MTFKEANEYVQVGDWVTIKNQEGTYMVKDKTVFKGNRLFHPRVMFVIESPLGEKMEKTRYSYVELDMVKWRRIRAKR